LIQTELILFTNRFPFEGGETFLETEIGYLAASFDKITLYPLEMGAELYGTLPKNVSVGQLKIAQNTKIRNVILSFGKFIFIWYFNAFFKSHHRKKYLTQFRFTWNTLIGYLFRADTIFKAFRSNPENTVYYSYWFNDWASALALARRKGLKGKFVVRAHGYDYDEKQNGRGYFPFRESEMNQFDPIAQISKYGKNAMKGQYPASRNIEVHKLGVRDCGFNAGGKDNEVYHLVSCSNFVPLKRISLLIDILSKLELPFQWIHFGGGKGKEEAEIYAKTRLKDGTFSFAGSIKNAKVLGYYRTNPVDLFLNMSELEGIPVSLMEAISAGIPLVGCNVCGVPEIVCKESGLLLPANPDSELVSKEIGEFLITKSRSMQFRRGVKLFWENHFNADSNYPNFVKKILIENQ